MEPKKNKAYDLAPKSGLFFNIGLVVSLLLVIMAFEWKFYDETEFVPIPNDNMSLLELIEMPVTVQPPPVAPIRQITVVEVKEDEEIPPDLLDNLDVQITVDAVIEEIFAMPAPEPEKVEEIVEFPEVMAEPECGFDEYYKAISKSLKYPPQATRMGIQGRVYVQFVVDTDGNVSDLQILKGIGGGCDEEAMRVIREGPKWKPGRVRALPVISRMRFPIRFVM